jgi:8-oxo-dGTP diphosphatase
MYVTTDAVPVRFEPGRGLRVLLIQRANEPFQGMWCVPGGFVELDEDLPVACARELEEETALRPAAMVQVGAFGTPGRDPRGRNVTVAYLAMIAPGATAAAGDDAAGAAWHDIGALPPLGFDHADIVAAALGRLRLLAGHTHLALALLPATFDLEDLQEVLSAVRREEVSRAAADAFARRASLARDDAGHWTCAADFLAALAGGDA